MKKLAAYNIKGGVGKTTTAVNLACMLARQGHSVLLWDLDPQGGSSFFFNLQNLNNNTHYKLFDNYITVYDVIQSTDTYHIDVISNDSLFSDQFMNKASKLTAVNYINHETIKLALKEVEDDYDICIFDCSPGKFLLHDNIFEAADAILVPNVPSPLSVYCNNLLLHSLENKLSSKKKILSFFNMVQGNKNIHKYFLEKRHEGNYPMLRSFIPFYTEIEYITLKKESIFHQLKQSRTSAYYSYLWNEICETMSWPELADTGTLLLSMKDKVSSATDAEPLADIAVNMAASS